MPVVTCVKDGKPGFKYGEGNKTCFTYEAGSTSGRSTAKRKAVLQGAAIAQNTGEKLIVKEEKDTLTFELKKEKSLYKDENNLVFGWGYEAIKKSGQQVVDHSKQFVDEGDALKELELATYAFNIGSGRIGFGHVGKSKGYVAECMFFTKEKNVVLGLSEDALPQGAWLGVYFPEDEDYKRVKKMKAPMFSLEGYGFLEEVKE